jgi:hypothetical protein
MDIVYDDAFKGFLRQKKTVAAEEQHKGADKANHDLSLSLCILP